MSEVIEDKLIYTYNKTTKNIKNLDINVLDELINIDTSINESFNNLDKQLSSLKDKGSCTYEEEISEDIDYKKSKITYNYTIDTTREYDEVLITKKNNKVYDIELYSDKERVLTNNNYYLSSKNKNIEDIYDTKGNKISSYNYNAYGIIDTKVSGYSYTGEHKDNTGLIYLRARYYKEEYKQLITKDTYKGEITNPLSQNQYTYANNNPIKYIDPSGHLIYKNPLFFNETDNIRSDLVVGILAAPVNLFVGTVKTATHVALYSSASIPSLFAFSSTGSALRNYYNQQIYNTGSEMKQFVMSTAEIPFINNYYYSYEAEQYRNNLVNGVQNNINNFANSSANRQAYLIGYGFSFVSCNLIASKAISDYSNGNLNTKNSINSNNVKFGSNTKSYQKLTSQIKSRGWTDQLVKDTIDRPYTVRVSINVANNNPATVFYNKSGAYVIVDNLTLEVVQVSDNLNPISWIPDKNIINPFKP